MYDTFWGSWTIFGHSKSEFRVIFGIRNQLHSLLNYCDYFYCINMPEVILEGGGNFEESLIFNRNQMIQLFFLFNY